MNLNKTMKHFGLAGTGVIVLLLLVVVYYLHLIKENTSLEAFSVGGLMECAVNENDPRGARPCRATENQGEALGCPARGGQQYGWCVDVRHSAYGGTHSIGRGLVSEEVGVQMDQDYADQVAACRAAGLPDDCRRSQVGAATANSVATAAAASDAAARRAAQQEADEACIAEGREPGCTH